MLQKAELFQFRPKGLTYLLSDPYKEFFLLILIYTNNPKTTFCSFPFIILKTNQVVVLSLTLPVEGARVPVPLRTALCTFLNKGRLLPQDDSTQLYNYYFLIEDENFKKQN